MSNPVRKKIHVVTAGNKITGSIYKVCSNGASETIESASYGWQTGHLNPVAPANVGPLQLYWHANAGNGCVEADFTYVSASIGSLVFYKDNGGTFQVN